MDGVIWHVVFQPRDMFVMQISPKNLSYVSCLCVCECVCVYVCVCDRNGLLTPTTSPDIALHSLHTSPISPFISSASVTSPSFDLGLYHGLYVATWNPCLCSYEHFPHCTSVFLGRWHYVLIRLQSVGVTFWGVLMAIVWRRTKWIPISNYSLGEGVEGGSSPKLRFEEMRIYCRLIILFRKHRSKLVSLCLTLLESLGHGSSLLFWHNELISDGPVPIIYALPQRPLSVLSLCCHHHD